MWLPIVITILTVIVFYYFTSSSDVSKIMNRIRAERSYPIFGHTLSIGKGGSDLKNSFLNKKQIGHLEQGSSAINSLSCLKDYVTFKPLFYQGQYPFKPLTALEKPSYRISMLGLYNALLRMWKSANMETFRLDIGPLKIAVISSAENVEALLSSQTNIDKLHEFYEKLIPWLGRGLLISSGDKWQTHRKILTPAFHFKILESYVNIFQHEARVLAKKLSKYSADQDFDIHPLVSLAAFSGICETAMGIKVNAQEKPSEYMEAVEEMCKIAFRRQISWYKRSDFVFQFTYEGYRQRECLKVIGAKTESVIKSRRQELLKEVKKPELEHNEKDDSFGIKNRRAFLDILLLSTKEDGQPLSDQDIKDEVNTFIFEGHDTTTSCLAFTFYALSQNPEVQDKILDEQRRILGNDLTRDATFAEINDMKYLEKVIKESLRLYPAVPLYGRTISQGVTLPDGTELPKNGKVLVLPILMNLNPKVFPEPNKFDPERFSSDLARHPYAYVPFSAGPRNCIGQKFALIEIKAYLSVILRKWCIEATPGFKPILDPEVTLKSENGVLIRVKPRIL